MVLQLIMDNLLNYLVIIILFQMKTQKIVIKFTRSRGLEVKFEVCTIKKDSYKVCIDRVERRNLTTKI